MATIPDLPEFEGTLRILASGQYRYTEPPSDQDTFGDFPEDPGFVEFVIHPSNGTVEVATAGSPTVPWQVMVFVAQMARARARQ